MPPSLRILLAEHDPATLAALRSHLETLGHVVVGPARSGREALDLFGREKLDAAVLELRMPDIGGMEVARRIAHERPIPLVLLAAGVDPKELAEATTLPIFHFLVEPVGPEDLRPAIRVAQRRFEEWTGLRNEAEWLGRKLEDRKVIEQAKGILMDARGLTEKDAYTTLRRESQNRNLPMAEIARTLVSAEVLLRDPFSS